MKRLICLISGLMACMSVMAQTQSLEFHFIAHDRTTPVSALCEKIERLYEAAVNDDDRAMIFYMPNYDQPVVVKLNMPGENGGDFRKIIRELRVKPSHEIYADIDYANILELFNDFDFIGEDGSPVFSSVVFNWYVNPDFWKFGYNEDLIAALCFDLELAKYPDYVQTRILSAGNSDIDIDGKYPLGAKDLARGANVKFLQY